MTCQVVDSLSELEDNLPVKVGEEVQHCNLWVKYQHHAGPDIQRDGPTIGMRCRSILRMSLSYFGPENSCSNAATSGGRPVSFDSFDSPAFDTLESSVLDISMSSVFDIFRSPVVDMMSATSFAGLVRCLMMDQRTRWAHPVSSEGDVFYTSLFGCHVRGSMPRLMTWKPPPGGTPRPPYLKTKPSDSRSRAKESGVCGGNCGVKGHRMPGTVVVQAQVPYY